MGIRGAQHAFLDKWLEEFSISRRRAVDLANGLISRIAHDLGLPPEGAPHQSPVRKGWLAGAGHITWRRLIAQFHQDRAQLKSFRARAEGKILFIADTKRISRRFDMIEIATMLEKSRPVQSDGASIDRLSVLIFSPNLFIDLEQVPADVHTVGYLALVTSVMQRPWLVISQILISPIRRSYVSNYLLGLTGAVFGTLLSDLNIKRCIMLTSNSYVVEAMRWNAITSKSVEDVVEILHGIPTVELVGYMDAMAVKLPTKFRAKLSFIHPIAGLKFSALQGQMIFDENIIINLRIKQYGNTYSFDQALADLVKRLPKNGCYRISINGGADHSSNYADSLAFLIERKLMSEIRNFARLQSVPIEVCYSVHPGHYKSGASVSVIEAIGADIIFSDSVDSWLTSDLCISLFSSSAWDATYVGCPALIMASEQDNIYPATLLTNIGIRSSATTGEALQEALQKLLTEQPIGDEVIKARLNRVFEGSEG